MAAIEDKLTLVNRFSRSYNKVFGEHTQISNLMEDPMLLKDCVKRALLGDDPTLLEAALAVAKAEGINNSSGSALGGIDWERIKKAAIEASGPIGGILVQKVKGKNPSTMTEAVNLVAEGLGGQGAKFKGLFSK